jgi:3-hydroxyacyl-[acyl-carrier-protein] dehydratase
VADRHPIVAASGRVHALDAVDLRRAVARLAARLPVPTPGSHVVFAFDRDLAAFAVALLAVWQRGHAVALPASARRRHVGPVMERQEVVALVHDTGAGLGIDVARLLAEKDVDAGDTSTALRLTGPLTVFAPDGSMQRRTAAALDTEIVQAIADLALQPGTRVADLCPPSSAGALVPGLLAPLAAGATVTSDAAGASVLVVPAAIAAPYRAGTRTIVITDPPDVPPPAPAYHALAFAAVPRTNSEGARFRTTVPHDFFGFAGHFPGYPVLSGAVQLHELVLPCLRAAVGTVTITAFQDLKFLARIAPGDTIELLLRRDEARGTCEFEIVRGTVRCSAGRAVLRAADAERTP